MDTKKFFRCSNCNSTDFEKTTIGDILATEGCFYVNAYACTKCGHIELFDPDYDQFSAYLREQKEIERKKQVDEYHRKETERLNKISKLKAIIEDENSTMKQVREAKEKMNELMQHPTPRNF